LLTSAAAACQNRSNNNVSDWKEFERLKELPNLQDLLLGTPRVPLLLASLQTHRDLPASRVAAPAGTRVRGVC
jgi:hypothetical protein